MNNKAILVPTDFSEACRNAVKHGAALSKITGNPLVVFHVINNESSLFFKKAAGDVNAEDRLKEVQDFVRTEYGIEIGTEIRKGSIFREIPRFAKEIDAAFMILGTRGKAGIQKLIGNQAMRIVEKSPIPTLVVQKRVFGSGYENIVFPVNIDIEFGQKVYWSVYFAKYFNSKVHIFVFREDNPELQARINNVVQQITEAFELAEIPVSVKTAKNQAAYANQLLEFAASVRADLIPIMTDNDEFEPAFIFTSLDEKMVYNTQQIPVMCINPKNPN